MTARVGLGLTVMMAWPWPRHGRDAGIGRARWSARFPSPIPDSVDSPCAPAIATEETETV